MVSPKFAYVLNELQFDISDILKLLDPPPGGS